MNLIDGLQQEMNRVREIVKIYEEMPYGNFAASLMKLKIKEAETAISSGEIVKMIQSYQSLKSVVL